jgi:hypothetical protein
MLEKDMYESIKKHLIEFGYNVKAEVLNTDITAIKDDEVLIVEMKKTLNTRLIYQGCKRQRVCDYVYLAIIEPTSKILRSSQFKEKVHIIRRLQLGLIFINLEKDKVETFLDPKNFALRQNKIKKRKLLREFEQRITSLNVGGVTKTKIITAYREKAIRIAYYLSEGPMKLKDIRTLTQDDKCGSILQKNYYGWFERVERGVYGLTEVGQEDLDKYENVVKLVLNSKDK